MKQLAAIRTNKWTEEEDCLLTSLKPFFREELAVVFHNPGEEISTPIDVIDISNEWLDGAELRNVPDWGWRCGDYFYYRLREAKPEYDYYWLIEPDVFFEGPCQTFFERFSDSTEDALGLNVREMTNKESLFLRGVEYVRPMRAVFALTRLSGALIDELYSLRAQMSKLDIRPRMFPNDEIHVFSNACDDNRFNVGLLEDYAEDLICEEFFRTDPSMLLDFENEKKGLEKGYVRHPVLPRNAFISKVGKRIAQRPGLIKTLKRELQFLTSQELDLVAQAAQARIREHLKVNTGK